MVSYFSAPSDINHFVKIIREEYNYTGNLGGKFETPYAIYNAEQILAEKKLTLAMFGRGDLRVEMDPRAVINMHDVQAHFFSICEKYGVESICATGFGGYILYDFCEGNTYQVSLSSGNVQSINFKDAMTGTKKIPPRIPSEIRLIARLIGLNE